jgi:hypothetical protein
MWILTIAVTLVALLVSYVVDDGRFPGWWLIAWQPSLCHLRAGLVPVGDCAVGQLFVVVFVGDGLAAVSAAAWYLSGWVAEVVVAAGFVVVLAGAGRAAIPPTKPAGGFVGAGFDVAHPRPGHGSATRRIAMSSADTHMTTMNDTNGSGAPGGSGGWLIL